jgi:adenylate cyclase
MEQMTGFFPVREISRVAVVGRREPVVVYKPMMPEDIDEKKQQMLTRFAEGFKLFYAGNFSHAQNIFSSLAQNDPVTCSYITKCRELIEHPPEDWQGVWVITTK